VTKEANKAKRAERMARAKHLGTHTADEWSALVDFCGARCVKCSGASGLANVEKDHIVAVYRGGCDCIHNLQPMCARCNAGKSQDFTDYRPPSWQKAVFGE
jgi:uncharacterized cysteine cluster protein YcgN (CxxCxxCC family)